MTLITTNLGASSPLPKSGKSLRIPFERTCQTLDVEDPMGVVTKLKKWYEGTYVPPPENDPSSPVVFFGLGHYERPWIARAISAAVAFWKSHWQWVIATLLALAGIAVSLK